MKTSILSLILAQAQYLTDKYHAEVQRHFLRVRGESVGEYQRDHSDRLDDAFPPWSMLIIRTI